MLVIELNLNLTPALPSSAFVHCLTMILMSGLDGRTVASLANSLIRSMTWELAR